MSRRHSGLILALGTAAAAILVAATLLAYGTGVEGWHLATRWTARLSAFIFLSAFLARPLVHLAPSPTTRAMLRERRGIGLGFAGAHTVHLAAILTYLANGGPTPAIIIPVMGGIAYFLIALMALTSNDRSQRALGRNWKRIHTVGIYYIWMFFTFIYLRHLSRDEAIYYVMTALFFVALAIRLAASRKLKLPDLIREKKSA